MQGLTKIIATSNVLNFALYNTFLNFKEFFFWFKNFFLLQFT